jgi:S-adenosylmethionine:tRNA ribosyltransferase-isomerase
MFHSLTTINLYDYKFPASLIAQSPATPRDSAKLLVYNKKSGKVFYDIFRNLPKYLPKNAVLVFNETKVIPARLVLHKGTGGKVKILYLETVGKQIKVLSNKRLIKGSVLSLQTRAIFCRGKKWPGEFRVTGETEKGYLLTPLFPISKMPEILEKYGETPIPPYIKNSPLTEKQLKEKYQTVFAKQKGSVAAPTASLHFTKALLDKIKKSGVDIKFVTLHVNLGTFAPLTLENLKSGKLHEEYFKIDPKTADFLNKAHEEGRPIIAVGTTVTRTLESACKSQKLARLSGTTDLFIQEGYEFKFIDGMITNFHVPESSLLMLVAALIGKKELFEIYKKAIAKKFRLFSFGDGMLII